MNAIEILNKELAGKIIIIYAPTFKQEVHESLSTLSNDWWQRGIESKSLLKKITCVSFPSKRVVEKNGAEYELQLDCGMTIPCNVYSRLNVQTE